MFYNKDKRPSNRDYRSDFFAMVDDFFKDWGYQNFEDSQRSYRNDRHFVPSMNISETKDTYAIETELPGVEKKDVKIEMYDNMLTIKGQKKSVSENHNNYHRIETIQGDFYRTVTLPKDVDSKKVSAEFENGILKIEVAKHTKSLEGKRTIAIG